MSAVHPYAIAGFLSALAAAHATVVVCVAAFSARSSPRGRAPDRTLPTFGFLNLAMVLADSGLACIYARASEGAAALVVPLVIADVGRLWTIALLVHFVLQYAYAGASRTSLAATYATATLLSIACVVERLTVSSAYVADASFVGLAVPGVRAGPTIVGAATGVATLVGAVVSFIVLRRTRARREEERVAIIGLAVLGATILWDAIGQAGLALWPPAAPYGYAFLVNSLIVTLIVRYTGLREALEARARELKDKTQDLARSYANLRAAQDELVRKEQLTAVGELSAVVAHEVRNPLAIISNAVATLRRSGVDEADRDTLLGILDEETSRLNRLVGDLLRYTRPITPERHLISIRDLVTRGMALTQGKIGLDVDVVEPEPTEKNWGDPNLLRQVVDNLIDNAIQAMSSGGVLTVTLVNTTQDGTVGVEIQIQDTGEGMDTEVRARALDPFFTTRPSGTGLGLAIVARIVDAHGGVIRIKSKAGSGTAMHVFLPRSAEQPPKSRPSSDPGRASSDPMLPPDLARSVSRAR